MAAKMIRIDESRDESNAGFQDGEVAFLRYTLDWEGMGGWLLYYLDHPESPSPGVDVHFIPGALVDRDGARSEAREWLESFYGPSWGES